MWRQANPGGNQAAASGVGPPNAEGFFMVDSIQAASVTLVDVGVYEERVLITPMLRPEGWAELRVESRLDSARNPEDLHVRYRVTLDMQGLLRLRGVVDAALGAGGPAPDQS